MRKLQPREFINQWTAHDHKPNNSREGLNPGQLAQKPTP